MIIAMSPCSNNRWDIFRFMIIMSSTIMTPCSITAGFSKERTALKPTSRTHTGSFSDGSVKFNYHYLSLSLLLLFITQFSHAQRFFVRCFFLQIWLLLSLSYTHTGSLSNLAAFFFRDITGAEESCNVEKPAILECLDDFDGIEVPGVLLDVAEGLLPQTVLELSWCGWKHLEQFVAPSKKYLLDVT